MPKYCKNCYKEKIDLNVKDEDLSYDPNEAICDGCGELKHLVLGEYAPAVETVPETQINEPEEALPKLIEPDDIMTEAECNCETQKHIEMVRKFIRFMTDKLTQRGVDHDASKLTAPEVELFAKYTKHLAGLDYDSDEYKASLDALGPALDHHYATNRHHPEHFANGITDMTLIDIMEMLCDWKASTLRMNGGNLLKSIETNAARFKINGQFKQILINTARMIDEQEIK